VNKMIGKIAGLAALPVLFLFLQVVPARAGAVEMEIFYLPHRPAIAVVEKVEQVAAEFDDITIKKYSFEDPDAGKLLEKYGITEHMPVAVFINGKNSFTVNGRSLKFRNFPKGDAFVPTFAGEWDYSDLRTVLTELAGGK